MQVQAQERADWLAGEDALLARGMLRFGIDYARIRTYFLPTKPEEELPARIKQLTRPRWPDNPVKVRIPILR